VSQTGVAQARAALSPRDRGRAGPSPNHLAKRDEIVSAAVEVLLRDGVHRCTARAIASAAGVSKGAVHYYFRDVDEIVDMAMAQATRGWISWLRSAAAQASPAQPRPAERFWRVIIASLEPFAHGDRTLMPLWLDYWAACTRARRTEPLRTVHGLLTSYIAELLSDAGVSGASERSLVVTCYLFGAGMQEPVRGVDVATVVQHVALLSGVDPLPG
jgi:AcrR family transcriptional regulator